MNIEYSFGKKICSRGCMHDVEDCLCGCDECQAWDSGIEDDDDEFKDLNEGEL
jgi:hypothetical protein